MLDPATAFSWGSLAAVLGWASLLGALFVPRLRSLAWPLTQIALPALLAAFYVALIWLGREGFAQGGFESIAEVRTLFANDAALTAGWMHYLAFDLFIGTWIARDGLARGISPFLILPCLPLTFLFGPMGLLLYLAVRGATPGRAQAEQPS